MKLYGLIGNPLSHSFSKAYFTKKFKDENILDCSFENFELPDLNALPELIQHYSNLRGLSVTKPYKEEVLTFLDSQDKIVTEIKACNCIKVFDDKLYGYNTDAAGFEGSLMPYLLLHHTKALILGTGGAAKAVQFALRKLQIEYLNVSRSQKKGVIAYTDLTESLIHEHNIIINSTPLGMYSVIDEAPPIPYKFITAKHLLYDLTYNPPKTLFLQRGEKQGAAICNGHDMLVIQAEESWKIWNGNSGH